ncbi:MAG: AAA family ATPase [Victivallales bacterium]|nr:AAA family ATPase [Victivallales bacterium]
MPTHGLTLGKFAPLHRGHQLMIETALREMDEVTVMIYHTSWYEVQLPVRAAWLRQLYPQIHVIEAWDGPEIISHDREVEIMHEQYILKMLDGTKITHFYSSEFYGEHVSRALGAVDRRVDDDRVIVPVSGTIIRENPYACRQYISDVVYRDLITKCVFLGAPSTGKSTLAAALAQKYHTRFVPEYGREYWEQHQVDRRFPLQGFDAIVAGHLASEERAFLASDRYCFIDTNAITTYMFSLDYHGAATPYVTRVAEENASRYDLFFLCGDDIPYEDTPDRSGDQKRHEFQQAIIADLRRRKIPYLLLTGTPAERMAAVAEAMARKEGDKTLCRKQ